MPELAAILAEYGPSLGRVVAAYAGTTADREDRLYEALTRAASLVTPIAILVVYVVALTVVAVVGVARVRVLRRELSELQRVQAELSD